MKRGEFDDLVAFATIARARSFTRAAAELGLSPSALSHGMRGLEARLDVRLLARTTRSVAATSAGERLLRSIESAVEDVEAGIRAMGEWQGEPSGSIRLTASQFAAQTVLAPALPQFLLENPKISVEVSVDSRLTDLVSDGFDAGIRWGDSVAQDMVAVRVGPPARLIVVGSPAYLDRNPPPQTPADLDRHNCILFRLVTGGGYFPWKLECKGKEFRCRAQGRLILDDPDLAVTLIMAGAGLGLILEPKAAPHLAAGQLVHVLEDWDVPFKGQHLYYPHRQVTPALRALIDALKWRPPDPHSA